MGSVLVTGASGFVGSNLLERLEGDGTSVVPVSRKPVPSRSGAVVTGSFTSEASLREIDHVPIDTVVHLAAEIGGCSEEDGLAVNVAGTRRMMRHFVDRGVRRFVLASSVAAPVGLDRATLPLELPIPDDHPTVATDAYGLSKALMEELAFYFQRQCPELDITMFRIGVVLKPDAEPASSQTLEQARFPFVSLSAISIHDVVEAFRRAITSPPGPGVHRMNLVAPWTRTDRPVPDTLRSLLGSQVDQLDLSHYQRTGHEFDALFTTARLQQVLGFVPRVDPRLAPATGEGQAGASA
jgi:nucleoside-diphosphate-sugar epimerase